MDRLTTSGAPGRYAFCSGCSDKPLIEKCDLSESCYHRQVYDRLAAYEDAEEQGLLVRLPCKPNTTVYTIQEDYFDCSECSRGGEAKYDPKINRQSCEFDDDTHCPYSIKENIVQGFNLMSTEDDKWVLSNPGEWGCEGLETYYSVAEFGVYYSREEAEAALKEANQND